MSDQTNASEVFKFTQGLQDPVRSFILQDLDRWVKITRLESAGFESLWKTRQEFRSLIAYRLRIAQKKFDCEFDLTGKLKSIVGNSPWMFVSNLFISCNEIGPGFYIEHGFSSIVYAKKIGKNFWLNQNVTIGTGKGGNPTILDDVSVHANSVVIGNIEVADGVTVGAGAVLNFEVPPGSRVVMQKPRVLT